jgi:hypothetical protein
MRHCRELLIADMPFLNSLPSPPLRRTIMLTSTPETTISSSLLATSLGLDARRRCRRCRSNCPRSHATLTISLPQAPAQTLQSGSSKVSIVVIGSRVPLDSIQEYRLQTNNYAAKFESSSSDPQHSAG